MLLIAGCCALLCLCWQEFVNSTCWDCIRLIYKLKIMILLIILGSGARAAAATAAGTASPAPSGVAQLVGQLPLSLGMIFVSIPKVSYVLSIYRYLRVTVPEVSGLCLYVSLYLYFLFVQFMFCQNTLYCDTRSFWCTPYPIPRSSFCQHKMFCHEGGVRPKDQNIYAQPHHMYQCNGGGCGNTFLL